MKRAIIGSFVVGALIGAGCLPGDIRPEPGRVYVSAEASDSTVNGFTTDDGWTIKFDKLLVGLGNVQLVGDACNDYANASYDRLFNFTLPGVQKLGEVYGLNGCELQFRLRSPSTDSLLEKGVTAADREFMRDIGNIDLTTLDGPPPRTAVYMRGTAVRGTQTKHFDWKFVARYTLSDCVSLVDGTTNSFLHLKAGDDLRPIVSFHADEVFRSGLDAGDALQFNIFANADKDADGNVSLEELEAMPAPIFDLDGGVGDGGTVDGGVQLGLAGLATVVTTSLVPRALYFDGNRCVPLPQGQGRGGGGPGGF